MLKLQIQSLALSFFKGAKDLKISFDKETTIEGKNGSFKTTVVDAVLWLLFDKDSTGRKDFGIKTLDKKGETLKDVEHSVEGIFLLNGDELVLRKTFREKWQRKRGSKTAEFIGNENLFFWNEVPIKKDEYNSKIKEFICDEETFRLFTDLKYFNNLPWQKRRTMLESLLPVEKKVDPFEVSHLKNKTADELRKQMAATKKKLLDQIEQCPTRIDEINRSIKDETEVDINALEDVDAELKSIDTLTSASAEAAKKFNEDIKELNKKKTVLFGSIETRKSEIKEALRESISTLEEKLNSKESELTKAQRVHSRNVDELTHTKKSLTEKNASLELTRSEYIKLDETEFSDSLNCPTCGAEFKEERKEELISAFNESKADRLEQKVQYGNKLKAEIKTLEEHKTWLESETTKGGAAIEVLGIEIEELGSKIKSERDNANKLYAEQITTDGRLESINIQINKLDSEIEKLVPSEGDNTDLVEKRRNLTSKRQQIVQSINDNADREKSLKRIEEIEQERLDLLDKLSEAEATEYELSEYIQRMVNRIELGLSKIFGHLQFKMFEPQINGELNPTCVVMMNGVPYSELNTAAKVWVSLEIIKVFSDQMQVFTPIFIDNRESVTEIPDLPEHQIISLKVNPICKTLKIK